MGVSGVLIESSAIINRCAHVNNGLIALGGALMCGAARTGVWGQRGAHNGRTA
jgi:hypothetical protein